MGKTYDYCATCRQPKPPSRWAYCCRRCQDSRGGREPGAPPDLVDRLLAVVSARDSAAPWERPLLDAEASRILREALRG